MRGPVHSLVGSLAGSHMHCPQLNLHHNQAVTPRVSHRADLQRCHHAGRQDNLRVNQLRNQIVNPLRGRPCSPVRGPVHSLLVVLHCSRLKLHLVNPPYDLLVNLQHNLRVNQLRYPLQGRPCSRVRGPVHSLVDSPHCSLHCVPRFILVNNRLIVHQVNPLVALASNLLVFLQVNLVAIPRASLQNIRLASPASILLASRQINPQRILRVFLQGNHLVVRLLNPLVDLPCSQHCNPAISLLVDPHVNPVSNPVPNLLVVLHCSRLKLHLVNPPYDLLVNLQHNLRGCPPVVPLVNHLDNRQDSQVVDLLHSPQCNRLSNLLDNQHVNRLYIPQGNLAGSHQVLLLASRPAIRRCSQVLNQLSSPLGSPLAGPLTNLPDGLPINRLVVRLINPVVNHQGSLLSGLLLSQV